jgi:WD40 repeat protein
MPMKNRLGVIASGVVLGFLMFSMAVLFTSAQGEDSSGTPTAILPTEYSPTDYPEELIPTDKFQPESVWSMAWSPDDSQIAVAIAPPQCNQSQNDYAVQIIDVATQTVIKKYISTMCIPTVVQWLNNGTHIAITRLLEGFRIIDIATNRTTYFMTNPLGFYGVSKALLSPDNQSFMAYDQESPQLHVWKLPNDLQNSQNLSADVIIQTVSDLTDTSWNPNSQQIVGSTNQGMTVWDANTGDEIRNYTIDVQLVRWSPNGKSFAITNGQHQLQIIDVTTGQVLLERAVDSARDLQWSPDNRHLAIGTLSGQILIVDTISNTVVDEYYGSNFINVLAWNSDGTQLAYGGVANNGEINIVTLDLSATPTLTPTFIPIPPTSTP